MRMSAKALRRHLIKQKTPDALREQIEEVCARQRDARRVLRIKQTLRTQAWGELIAPLKDELRTAQASLRYHQKNEDNPSADAFTAYIMQMQRLLKNLERLKNKPDTDGYASPLTLAREARLPNDGQHWSDWLSAESKAKVQSLFDDIPYRHKAKRKQLYERVLTLSYRKRTAGRALEKAKAEADGIERELLVRNKDREKNERLHYIGELEARLSVVKLNVDKLEAELKEVEDAGRSKK
jgi:hypothetical protein